MIAATHGGTVARTYQERRTAQYYFCIDTGDPWVERYDYDPFSSSFNSARAHLTRD
jgi:hypothetical protein